MVSIPDKRAVILSRVFKKPVIDPARAPAAAAAGTARRGLTPATMSRALTAAPKGKLPSTLKSA